MHLSQTKINQLELIASKYKVNPDLLVDALLDVGLRKQGKKKEEKTNSKLLSEKIKAIECEAIKKGWKKEQLWNIYKYPRHDLMGLIYYIDNTTEITNVTERFISILHKNSIREPTVLNFYNNKVGHPWIMEVNHEYLK